jgi:signal transduction histidine kinase/FixJ family two-component response regulator
MKNIFHKMGKPLEFIESKTWTESMQNAKDKRCDLIAMISPTEERDKYFNFTTAFLESNIVFASTIDKPYISNIKSILSKKIGVVKTHLIGKYLKEKYPSKEIDIVNLTSLQEGFKKLESGEIDFLVDTLIMLNYNIQVNHNEQLKISGIADIIKEYKIATRIDEPLLGSIIQKSINSIDSKSRRNIEEIWLNPTILGEVRDYSLEWKVLLVVSLIILILMFRQYESIKQKKLLEKTVKDKTRELKLEKERAEESTKAKSEFLASMSHEIRTPINGILGILYLLLETNLNDKQKEREYISKIDTSAKNLLRIINDILDFSKMEAGKLEINKSTFNLKSIVERIVDLLKPLANKKGLDIFINYSESINNNFYGDPLRVGQILTNIIGNAIKFTDKGNITIYISKNDNKIKFEVKDTGIGLTTKEISKLFKSFSQADGSITRKYGGTGLGLSISKQLVELMNGKIWVESEIEKGSTFIFEIELVSIVDNKSDKEKEEKMIDKKSIKLLEGKNILLVEDNIINQEMMKGILDNIKLNISLANNGQEAVEKFDTNNNYDLILMDIQMPIMDGYQASRIIREKSKNIPIIALSANGMKEDIEKSKSAGANEHLVKPFDVLVLYKILVKYILEDEKGQKDEEYESTKKLSNFKYIDKEHALELLLGEEDLFLIAAKGLLKYKDIKLEELDDIEFNSMVHKIKGVAGSAGATKVLEIIEKLYGNRNDDLIKKFQEELLNACNEITEKII